MKKIIYDVIEKLKPVVEADTNINKIILFGSHAKGKAKLGSDVDLAFICDDPDTINRGELRYATNNFYTDFDFVYTTDEKLDAADKWSDVNYWIKKEGIVLWQR